MGPRTGPFLIGVCFNYALIACCEVGARRLVEMLTEFGLPDLEPLADYIIDTSLAGTRSVINQLPHGEWHSALLIDGYEQPIELKATLRIGSDLVELDRERDAASIYLEFRLKGGA